MHSKRKYGRMWVGNEWGKRVVNEELREERGTRSTKVTPLPTPAKPLSHLLCLHPLCLHLPLPAAYLKSWRRFLMTHNAAAALPASLAPASHAAAAVPSPPTLNPGGGFSWHTKQQQAASSCSVLSDLKALSNTISVSTNSSPLWM